jgi:glucose/arabinose dehydrogenase
MKYLCLFLVLITSSFSYSQTIGIQSFATGFSSPVDISHPVGDSRLFVVEQGGKIKILNPSGATNATAFLTLTTATISTGGERGLLGLAFHPNYATNGYFYVNYTNTAGNTVIARYSVSATNPEIANPTATILLTITQPFSNHNGGCLRFGPDGYLYIGMGDGGSAGDPGNRAQNITENLGKMLRIDVNSSVPYGIPPTNPYVGIAGNDEIWAIGMRNPWKFSFNRLNGDLWIADVGQDNNEEINKIVSPLANGLNFGWKCYEGNSPFNTTGCAAIGTMTFPIAQYTHSNGCSITGGYLYTGANFPNFTNRYFFADYCLNKIGILNVAGTTITWSSTFSGTNFSTFGEDMNGEIYIAGLTNGVIYKLIDTSLLNTNDFYKNNYSIYPNPTKSEVFVKMENTDLPSQINIYDLTGKLLLSKDLENISINKINISTLQTGIYLVNIDDNSGVRFSSKLTIN